MIVAKCRALFLRVSPTVAAAAIAVCMVSDQAFAYIDPGAASMALQAVIAGLAAVSAALFTVRVKVRQMFDTLFRRKPAEGDDRNNSKS